MKKCILIFDDDKEILHVCKIILEQHDYRVETRLRCEKIIEDMDQINPDIVLMDLWIPEIGGERAINLMKNTKATQHTPIILFSANAEIEGICRRSNANGFLKKPFTIDELTKIIEEQIRSYVA